MEIKWIEDFVALAQLRQVLPSPALQASVVNAIYGKEGVKAGFVNGQCMDNICAALEGLSDEGVEVVILGCTELPLLLPGLNG